jgi:hypothetical protein
VVGFCEYGDELSGSDPTELVSCLKYNGSLYSNYEYD